VLRDKGVMEYLGGNIGLLALSISYFKDSGDRLAQ
jgi:hypothetical protein